MRSWPHLQCRPAAHHTSGAWHVQWPLLQPWLGPSRSHAHIGAHSGGCSGSSAAPQPLTCTARPMLSCNTLKSAIRGEPIEAHSGRCRGSSIAAQPSPAQRSHSGRCSGSLENLNSGTWKSQMRCAMGMSQLRHISSTCSGSLATQHGRTHAGPEMSSQDARMEGSALRYNQARAEGP